MKRVIIAAVIVSFVTVGAYPASKTKTKTKKVTAVSNSASQTTATVPLTALFPAAQQQETMAAGGMVTMDAPNHEVVMVRINDDGTKSHACVNTEAAARKFLSGAKSEPAPAKPEN
ncbi:MAG TPA: hypothetical protein VN380_01050 [Thermoanaerobaculia bacterium]|nr:hypothetical protein [Thermoanaerobaculia bacterium]